MLCYFHKAIGAGEVQWSVSIFVCALCRFRTKTLQLCDDTITMKETQSHKYPIELAKSPITATMTCILYYTGIIRIMVGSYM